MLLCGSARGGEGAMRFCDGDVRAKNVMRFRREASTRVPVDAFQLDSR